MDNREEHEAAVERLAHAVGQNAERLHGWLRAAAHRHRTSADHARASTQRAVLARERLSWLRTREQAEIDRETRSSARRMAERSMTHTEPGDRAS